MVKVLFLQNLEHHKVGDIKDIPDGFARNMLLPKGIAVLATDAEIKAQQAHLGKMKAEEEKIVGKLTAEKEKLEAKVYKVEAQAGDEDKLFGAVTNRSIAEVLEKAGFEIDRHSIEIAEPIHTLGEHSAVVHLGHGVNADINLDIVRA